MDRKPTLNAQITHLKPRSHFPLSSIIISIANKFDYHPIYSRMESEPMAPADVLFNKASSPTFDGVMNSRGRQFLTIRTQEESMHLLSLLLQPPSPSEHQFHLSDQRQKPILATATQNYGEIGSKTGLTVDKHSTDSDFDTTPPQSHRKRARPGYKQGDSCYEYLDTTVYFKQRKDGKTLAESAIGRKKTLIKPTLTVTRARAPNPIIFKDRYGNLIGSIQGKPVMRFE